MMLSYTRTIIQYCIFLNIFVSNEKIMNILKKIRTCLRCHHDYEFVRTERHTGYGEDRIYKGSIQLTFMSADIVIK